MFGSFLNHPIQHLPLGLEIAVQCLDRGQGIYRNMNPRIMHQDDGSTLQCPIDLLSSQGQLNLVEQRS